MRRRGPGFGWGPFGVLALLLLCGCGGAGPRLAHPERSSSGTAGTPTRATRSPRPVSLIAAATWVTRDGVRALRVTPTQAQRRHPELADTGWTQLVRKVAKADTPGMRDQYLCHAHFAPGKPSFFLEPARPAVGYAATVAAGCNPGVVRDVG